MYTSYQLSQSSRAKTRAQVIAADVRAGVFAATLSRGWQDLTARAAAPLRRAR